jgi:uncharacterized flavoprotein (TIGR03862 family)
MAAERLLDAGHPVVLCEAKPTVGRKLLMAGKSGLNLTKDEPLQEFIRSYGPSAGWLARALAFGPEHVQSWARELGQELFTGSSGRVFPVAMKASPLLRAWIARLRGKELEIRTGWRWLGFRDGEMEFLTPDGPRRIAADAVVLALGWASWARLGSDGAWAGILDAYGVPVAPFQPANMGFTIDWSPHMVFHFGQPAKPLALIAGKQRVRGEAVISRDGIEGGGIYSVSAALRDGSSLKLDLVPDLTAERAVQRLERRPSGETAAQALRKGLGLDPVRLALAMEFGRPWPSDVIGRVGRIKALPVPLGPPRPMDQAISTAGGIMATGLTDGLMLRALPGVFAAGEMLDWEAPTGGYLLTGCLATGRLAGDSAAEWLDRQRGQDQPVAP